MKTPIPLFALLALTATPAARAQTALFEIYGVNGGDQLGYSVAGGADFDKDGFDDIVVGTPFDNTGTKTNNGAVRVFSGLDGSLIHVKVGDADDDHFGWSVAIAGDVDGDTWPDVIVGAPNAESGAIRPGMARVFSGQTSATLWTFYGLNDGDEFGYAVAGGIDRDSDNLPDLIVGSPGHDLPDVDAGRVFVLSSVTGGHIGGLYGAAADVRMGEAVACVGDVDGLGGPDFAMGAPGADGGTGRVYVQAGHFASSLWDVGGSTPGDRFGSSVAGGLDLTGDGVPDVLVGAPEADDVAINSGLVRLLDGPSGSTVRTLHGDDPFDLFGASVAAIDDLDGDGLGEIVAGAKEGTLFGRGSARVLSTNTFAELFRAEGDAQSRFGAAVAPAGDVDGDGVPDFIVGGPQARDPLNVLVNFVGVARVISGRACGAFESYCTAGVSASGCQAQLSSTGTPSATAGSGFVVSATNVEGNKTGLFFYGAGGRQANPWGNGSSFQCVVPPVKRGGLLPPSGTAGACDGSFSQDLNARWCPSCPKSAHNFGEGAVVQIQLWYRDPLNTSNRRTSFSDAIEVVTCP